MGKWTWGLGCHFFLSFNQVNPEAPSAVLGPQQWAAPGRGLRHSGEQWKVQWVLSPLVSPTLPSWSTELVHSMLSILLQVLRCCCVTSRRSIYLTAEILCHRRVSRPRTSTDSSTNRSIRRDETNWTMNSSSSAFQSGYFSECNKRDSRERERKDRQLTFFIIKPWSTSVISSEASFYFHFFNQIN